MSNNEEVRQVLKMVADGKISVEEADQLIATIQESYAEEKGEKNEINQFSSKENFFPDFDSDLIPYFEKNYKKGKKGKAKWFRIKVTDLDTGKTSANLRLPIGFGNFGLHKFLKDRDLGLKGSEFDAIATMDSIDGPTMIIDIEDTDDNERVQIYIE